MFFHWYYHSLNFSRLNFNECTLWRSATSDTASPLVISSSWRSRKNRTKSESRMSRMSSSSILLYHIHTVTFMLSHSCHQTPVVTLLLSHSSSHNPVVTLLLSQSCCHNPVVTIVLSQSCCHTPVVTILLSHSCCHNPVVTLLLSQSCCHNPVVTLLLSHSCCHTPVVTILLSHSCSIPVVTFLLLHRNFWIPFALCFMFIYVLCFMFMLHVLYTAVESRLSHSWCYIHTGFLPHRLVPHPGYHTSSVTSRITC